MEESLKRVSLLGVPVDIIDDSKFDEIIYQIQDCEKHEQIRFLSYTDFIKAIFSKEMKSRLKSCALIITTSRRVSSATRFIHKTSTPRYNQFTFIIKLLGYIEKKGGSIYIIGGRKKDLLKTESNLRTSFPGLSFVGRFAGFYHKHHEKNLIEAVRKASPSLLLTGVGLKSKDNWLYKNKEKLNNGLCIFTRECFQIFSGKGSSRDIPLFNFIKKPWSIIQIFSMIWLYPAIIISRISRSK